MIRSAFKSAFTSFVLVGVLAIPMAGAARAQSPSDRVWVVDNITTQALSTCTTGGGVPCPAGSLQAFKQISISRADAEQQHRPYLETTATSDEVARFAENLYPHKAASPNASSAVVAPSAAGNCLETNVTQRWQSTIPNIGGNVSYLMTYHYHTDCTVSAVSDSPVYVMGPGVWACCSATVFGGGEFFADDYDGQPGTCHGLPNATYNFLGYIKFSAAGMPGNGPHSRMSYYGTGQCNSYDPRYLYDYYWG